MKKSLLRKLWIICCFISLSTISQTLPAGENISLDQQLSNIDQTSVSSGIIYERVLQKANLYNFNKSTIFNTANFDYFKQALSEMNRASNGLKFINVNILKTIINSTTAENAVDIAILNTEFSVLNYDVTNPTNNGLLYNNITNKFTAVANKVPFYSLNTSVIAATKDAISGVRALFNLRNDLFFKNGNKKIKTLTCNFDDGVTRTLITNELLANQQISINYTTSGLKNLVFTITYNDNSTLTTYSTIYFQKINNTPTAAIINDPLDFKENFSLNAEEAFTGFMPGDLPINANIYYRVFYSVGNSLKKILKPIILMDGFDPLDKRKIEDSDCASDGDCTKDNLKNGIFDPLKHESIVDGIIYNDGTEIKSLLTKLRELGFDVIIVNFPNNLKSTTLPKIDGGADYIERNGLAIVTLIKWVNNKLVTNGSTNKLAIFGPSMGGLISRYALAYMEKKFATTGNALWQHNTFLWVSVDSPHLGANIPLGAQALLNLVKNDDEKAKEFYEVSLMSPAAQEMLIEQHRENPEVRINPLTGYPEFISNYNVANPNFLNSQTTSQNMSQNRGSTFFQQHFNNHDNNGVANSHGWPVSNANFRKIAIVNGSLSGSRTNVDLLRGNAVNPFSADGAKVLNIRGFIQYQINFFWGGSITIRTLVAALEVNQMPAFGSNAQITRFKKLFNDKTTQTTNNNSRGCLDNVPGGYFGTQKLVADPILGTTPIPGAEWGANWGSATFNISTFLEELRKTIGISSYYNLLDYNPVHSFIPTFSSLAHLQPNQNWNNPLNTNLTCTTNKQTPFDSYFGSASNSEHVSFSKNSVEWLLKELGSSTVAAAPQLPTFPIQDNLLAGPNVICLNTNSTFSLGSDICKLPSAATWSVTPAQNAQIISSTSLSVILKGLVNGSCTITATFQNGQTVTKTIWVGKPVFDIQFNLYEPQPIKSHICIVNGAYGTTLAQQSVTNYTFKRCNSSTIFPNTTNNYCVMPGVMPGAPCCFEVTVTNICGSTTVFYNDCFSNDRAANTNTNLYRIYPNPSNSLVSIDLFDQELKPELKTPISGELFDMFGFSRSKVEIVENKANFSVVGLPKGIYILKINVNDKVESHQIAVE